MNRRALRFFRAASLIGGILAIALTPVTLVHSWLLLALFAFVVLCFPWAVSLLHNIASGTVYRFWRLPEVEALGLSPSCQTLSSSFKLLLVLAAVAGHWLKWPGWWVPPFEQGALGGPALAVFLFGSASTYHTVLRLREQHAVKRCPNSHAFSPFETTCPQCGLRKGFELVTSSEGT